MQLSPKIFPSHWLGRVSPKQPILCRAGRKTLNESISSKFGLGKISPPIVDRPKFVNSRSTHDRRLLMALSVRLCVKQRVARFPLHQPRLVQHFGK